MDTSKWKWFKISDIFQVKAGKYHYKDEYESGRTPYLSATAVNNGVGERINLSPEFEGGVITTEKVKCTAFYQPKPFCATSDVNIIKRKDGKPINQYIGLFLASIIDFNESFRWTYGRQCRVNDTENIRIKLPVTIDGTPDWQYMENFVKDTIIPQLPMKAQKVWLKKYDTHPQSPKSIPLNTRTWKWFNYTDLFRISGSKTTPLEDLEGYGKGAYPYVTTQAVNNGVEGYFNFSTEKGGVLTIDSAVLGFCSYQEKDFSASDHVEILTPLFKINKYIALFLTTIINKEQYRYSYGRKCSQIKLKKSRIKLPVTPSGEPDWQFMEDYIKSLPYSKNLELSDKDEPVDELMEYKKKVLELEQQLAAQQPGSINNYGTVNIYEH